MDRYSISAFINRFAAPVLVTLCGLMLLFRPDTATALLSLVLGWAAILWGIISLCQVVLDGGDRLRNLIYGVVLLIVGNWIRHNPWGLASGIGRVAGILILISALKELFGSCSTGGKVMSLAAAVVGVVLIVTPLTASRIVYIVCGILVTAYGVSMLLGGFNGPTFGGGGDGRRGGGRRGNRRNNRSWDDDDIIDAP